MDPKASAKSKRSHSQQDRKNHQLPAARSAQKKKAATGGGGGEAKLRRAHGSARDLPSNWDRYDDDDGDNGRDGAESSAGTKPADGEIRPKSKGADFSYLIDQARSRPQEHRDLGTSQSATSLDELSFRCKLYAFCSGGEGLFSWRADDKFIVDDDPTSSCEVPFLSMDLHALAVQLSKLKLSQRLFLEEDLLSEELIDKSEAYQISERSEAPIVSEHKYSLTPARFLREAELEKFADSQTNRCNSCNVHGIMQETVLEECQSQTSKEQATELNPTSDSIPPELSGSREIRGPMSHLSIHADPDLKQNRTSRSEAPAAEEELDVLLDTFSEASLSSSCTDRIIDNASTSRRATFNSSTHMSPFSVGQDPSSSGNAGTTLADAIDDLLAEAALPLNDQKYATSNVSFQSLLGSKPPGDSNSSKQVGRAASLDDAIENLLAETSLCLEEEKNMACQEKRGTTSTMNFPSHSSLGSKPVDDFDSWFDTL